MKKESRIFFGRLSGFVSAGLLFAFTAFHAVFFVRAVSYYSSKINKDDLATAFDIPSILLNIVKGLPVTGFMLLSIITSLAFCIYFSVKLIKMPQLPLKSVVIIISLLLFGALLFRLIPPQSYVVAVYSMVRFSAIKLGNTSSVLYLLLKMCQPLSIVFAVLSCILLIRKSEVGKESELEKFLLRYVSQKKQILYLLIIPFALLTLLGAAVFLVPLIPNFNILGSPRFVGFWNYVRLFSEDDIFGAALINTYIIPIIAIILTGLVLIVGKTIRMKNTVSINGMLYYPLCYLLLNVVFKSSIEAGTAATSIFGYPSEGYTANVITSHILDYSNIVIMGNSLIFLWFQLFSTFIILAVIWNVDAYISYRRAKHGLQKRGDPV